MCKRKTCARKVIRRYQGQGHKMQELVPALSRSHYSVTDWCLTLGTCSFSLHNLPIIQSGNANTRVAQFPQPPRAPMLRFLGMKQCSLLILTLWLVIPLSASAKMPLRWLVTGDLCCRDNGCSHTVCFASQIFADGLLQYNWWASLVK